MLTLYRLHGPTCKRQYARLDRSGLNCTCPVHVEGKLGSEFLRLSTRTRSMEKARSLVVSAEQRGTWEPPPDAEPPTPPAEGKPLSEAVQEFLADAADVKGRNLAPPTLVKYTTILNRLRDFGEQRGLTRVSDFTFSELTGFKRTWATGTLATGHNITRLRTFFAWCVKHKWIEENVAESVDMPSEVAVERLPYTDDEMSAILDAARTIPLNPQQPVTNRELETFILLMRYSGIGISDAALLQRSEIRGDEVRLYRKKTRRHAKRVQVVVPLPSDVLDRVKEQPLIKGRYYFAHGSDTLAAQVEAWRKRLAMVFKAAHIHNPGSHRFRHTFATDLLTRGVSIERVSRWLGHASIKITQEHYSHWIESRIQADSDVLRNIYRSDGRKPA